MGRVQARNLDCDIVCAYMKVSDARNGAGRELTSFTEHSKNVANEKNI